MKATAVLLTDSAVATMGRMATRILACSFLLIATAQASPSSALSQSPSARPNKCATNVAVEPHLRHELFRGTPVRAKLQKRSFAANVQPTADDTLKPVFLEFPKYPTGDDNFYPSSLAVVVGDFNRDGVPDLAVANSERGFGGTE